MNSTEEAQQLLRQGHYAEAERAFERVLEAVPDDVDALNAVALACARRGDLHRSLSLMHRAVAANPNNPVSNHHLARVQDSLGNLPVATEAHRRSVQLRPDFHVARLYLGEILERAGDMNSAVIQYVRALQDAQTSGRWLNPATTPEPLQPLIQHAVLAVRNGRRTAFAELLEPLVKKYGATALLRVHRTIDVYLNEATAIPSDHRQQPKFLYFPDLPTTPYFDRDLFPWITELELHTQDIRGELKKMLRSDTGRERVFDNEVTESENLRGVQVAPSWNGYYFYRHGERREDNCAACPITAKILDGLPLSRVNKHGPEVLFSVFTPGTHLLPHRGVTNTRLVSHLPLIVPRDCALNVGGEIHRWKESEVVVFDDTYEHEAWNRSDQIRVVLIFDIWNPYLTEVERAAIADLIVAIGDFRHDIETS